MKELKVTKYQQLFPRLTFSLTLVPLKNSLNDQKNRGITVPVATFFGFQEVFFLGMNLPPSRVRDACGCVVESRNEHGGLRVICMCATAPVDWALFGISTGRFGNI